MKIKINIKKLSIILLIVPIIVFFIFWLKIYMAVAATILLISGTYFIIKERNENLIINIDLKNLIYLIIFSLIICWLGGIGGFFYQYYDHDWRNAIFHDLINKPWPVTYNITNRYLSYYIAAWLIPALIGKGALKIGIDENSAWITANIILLLYCAIIVLTVMLCIVKFLKISKFKHILLVSVIFLLFSGMDCLGIILDGHNIKDVIIYEGWTGGLFEYQSMFTGLSWSYNQHEFAWLITLIILLDKNNKNLAFWGMLLFPFAPLPLVSIIIFAGTIYLVNIIKDKKSAIKIFSPQNITSILSVGIINLIYFSSNSAVVSNINNNILMINSTETFMLYLLFILVEAVPFILLTFGSNKQNILYYVASAILIIFPIFRIGTSMDFGMKATIPALLYFYLLICNRLLNHLNKKELIKKPIIITMIIVLILGSLTPLNEIVRGTKTVINEKRLDVVCDTIRTFDTPFINSDNFTSDTNSNFYIYIIKK